jgi:phage replication-related protein YjqB (UPF0714/DUF867 family)
MTDPSAPDRGKYGSFAELARHEIAGKDYRIEVRERADASILIVAPHGGLIEAGTSQIAESIAGEDFHLFSFEGLKPYGENRALHITSHRFDHPRCLELASRSRSVLSVHGCLGESCIHVGGLDEELSGLLAQELRSAGFKVEWPSARYPGRHPSTYDLRAAGSREAIAEAVRAALMTGAGSQRPQ